MDNLDLDLGGFFPPNFDSDLNRRFEFGSFCLLCSSELQKKKTQNKAARNNGDESPTIFVNGDETPKQTI